MLHRVPHQPPVDSGQRAWLHRLYVEEAEVVFRYAASRCGRENASEIVAETFVEAVRTGERFDAARGTQRAWLLGIATNRIRRRRGQESAHLRSPGADPGALDDRIADLPDRLDADALAPALRRELLSLPASERSAFLLHAVAELTPAEVAVALGIEPNAARVRLHRARVRLRAALNPPVYEEITR